MSELNPKQKETETSKRPNKILRLIIALVFLLVLSLIIWRLFSYKSAQEQLAAIEAALAIPDSENAAQIYLQLFEDYKDSNVSDLKSVFLTPSIDDITKSIPWSSQDYPEIARWLKQHQNVNQKLLQASKYEKCFFPITISSIQDLEIRTKNLAFLRQFIYMLIRSANNDIAEERIGEALNKYLCCIQTGRHIQQQPVAIDFLVGMSIEAFGLQKIRFLIMQDYITQEQLKTIESELHYTDTQHNQYWETMMKVERLYPEPEKFPPTTNSSGLIHRIKYWWQNRNNVKMTFDVLNEKYLTVLAERNGSRILVALRSYRDKTGKWPEKLNEIKPFLTSEDVLIDPQINSPFIYQSSSNNFTLYGSKGLTIWPLKTPQAQPQNVNIKQPDPNME